MEETFFTTEDADKIISLSDYILFSLCLSVSVTLIIYSRILFSFTRGWLNVVGLTKAQYSKTSDDDQQKQTKNFIDFHKATWNSFAAWLAAVYLSVYSFQRVVRWYTLYFVATRNCHDDSFCFVLPYRVIIMRQTPNSNTTAYTCNIVLKYHRDYMQEESSRALRPSLIWWGGTNKVGKESYTRILS